MKPIITVTNSKGGHSGDRAVVPTAPRRLRPDLWVFGPNRQCSSGTAWLLQGPGGSVLVDPPAPTPANLHVLQSLIRDPGSRGWIVLSSRLGHGGLKPVQAILDWPALVQEQEAYLLPGNTAVHSFRDGHMLDDNLCLH